MVNTFVLSFRKTKFSNLDLFSECFYNCMELQQGLSYFQDTSLAPELGAQTAVKCWASYVSDF